MHDFQGVIQIGCYLNSLILQSPAKCSHLRKYSKTCFPTIGIMEKMINFVWLSVAATGLRFNKDQIWFKNFETAEK